ncbi:hypothetical protein MRB53_020171 [Persea americana]|uniref:Uncharacterized protein n=1 Tax=Persea americana TaxID=3435 RepID=A0ACC2L1E1_PERAE|nr:hypothetical protein MRB53_020171 [Persea americana]
MAVLEREMEEIEPITKAISFKLEKNNASGLLLMQTMMGSLPLPLPLQYDVYPCLGPWFGFAGGDSDKHRKSRSLVPRDSRILIHL